MRVALLAPALAAFLLAPGAARVARAGGAGSLAVYEAGAWRAFWHADRAPQRWTAADSVVTRALEWKLLTQGLERTSLRLECGARG